MVEGYMDVIALAQHGVDNAVATLGTAVTENHLEKLYRVAGRLIFCFDGDEAGKKAAWRALEIALPLLREGRQALFNFMPEGHDPDSFIREYGAEQFRSDETMAPLSDFLLDKLKSGAGIATREGRATFLDLILPYLARMPGSGLRQLLLQETAATAQIDGAGLQKLLQDYRPGKTRRPRVARPPQQRERTGDISAVIAHILNRAPTWPCWWKTPHNFPASAFPAPTFCRNSSHWYTPIPKSPAPAYWNTGAAPVMRRA